MGAERTSRLTALITRDGTLYVALCPELDIASQGATVEAARLNLVEAVELFFECADAQEIQDRLHGETYITTFEARLA